LKKSTNWWSIAMKRSMVGFGRDQKARGNLTAVFSGPISTGAPNPNISEGNVAETGVGSSTKSLWCCSPAGGQYDAVGLGCTGD
jgi:hypothetical protein